MYQDQIEKRRAYISKMRQSFEVSDEPAQVGNFVWTKVRWLISIFLFVAFVFCDRTKSDFLAFKPDTVYEKLEENYDYTNLKKYVMIISNFDK